MVTRIEVGCKQGIPDVLGKKIARRIREHLGFSVEVVRVIDVYTIDGPLAEEELVSIAAGPLSDPIIQEYRIGGPLAAGYDWFIEVGYRPGVTDNVGKTARDAVLLMLGRDKEDPLSVYTSRQYAIQGRIGRHGAETISRNLLANELIEYYRIAEGSTWNIEGGFRPYVPRVSNPNLPHTETIDLEISDDELVALSEGRLLALNLDEMKAIRDYLRNGAVLAEREKVGLDGKVTDAELECLAQTWSEHCKHKIFNALVRYEDETGKIDIIDSLFDTFIKGATERIRKEKGVADFCLSVFEDNAGVIRFTDAYNLVFKVETHNSPSALDPYGGALTGIVGVNRDPFGTGRGAKLIFNTDVFCFARPDYDRPLPPRILHPRRILEGVREGVEHGGNKSGIPTINGCLVFDDRYLGKPLVYCGTGGIMPAIVCGEKSHKKCIQAGDLIVMTGGRVGKDGIHGATFSSQELHEGSPVTAVQIGDPITQKKMMDFLLIARDRCLYRTLTDNGAGGLSSSVGETARLSNGCELDLKKAPLKYEGLNPWEILVSESQERMTVAVPPEKIDPFLELARKMDVEATVLGRYTDTGMFHVRYGDETVAYLRLDFLHNGLPRMQLSARWVPPHHDVAFLPLPDDMGVALKRMLGRLNICSKEWVVRQYDHEVQGGSVIKPLMGVKNDGPSDAAVIRPLLDELLGIVVANGICPRYGDIDTYHMAACAIDEAVRNAVAVGGTLDHMAGLDNFCWCDPVLSGKNPDGDYKLAQLVRANTALYDITTAYGIPCISGKDSMKNDYAIGEIKISIPPTLLFSIIGRIDDVRQAVTMDVKRPGDLVYVLGLTRNELGGSEWYALHGMVGRDVPQVASRVARSRYVALNRAIKGGLIASCHDCSDGGLGCALAEMAIAGRWGMEIDLQAVPCEGISRDDDLLFSETQSRLVVTVAPEKQRAFEHMMAGQVMGQIGRVTAHPYLTMIGRSGGMIMREALADLERAWKAPLNF